MKHLRIRSGTRCSVKWCTSAPRHPLAHSCIATSPLPWSASAPRERRLRPPSSPRHFERGGDPAGAVRYYTEAAEGALSHFSPQECLAITERASRLLEEVAEGTVRNTLQIGIDTLHGLAATRVLGAGSEAKSAFRRAYSLLGDDEHPMRARLLHGFGFMLCLRAEYAEALAVADRAEALGSRTNDPALLSTASTVHGQVDQLQGRSKAARAWLERGLAAVDRLDVGPGEFLVDPQVALLAFALRSAASPGPGRARTQLPRART